MLCQSKISSGTALDIRCGFYAINGPTGVYDYEPCDRHGNPYSSDISFLVFRPSSDVSQNNDCLDYRYLKQRKGTTVGNTQLNSVVHHTIDGDVVDLSGVSNVVSGESADIGRGPNVWIPDLYLPDDGIVFNGLIQVGSRTSRSHSKTVHFRPWWDETPNLEATCQFDCQYQWLSPFDLIVRIFTKSVFIFDENYYEMWGRPYDSSTATCMMYRFNPSFTMFKMSYYDEQSTQAVLPTDYGGKTLTTHVDKKAWKSLQSQCEGYLNTSAYWMELYYYDIKSSGVIPAPIDWSWVP